MIIMKISKKYIKKNKFKTKSKPKNIKNNKLQKTALRFKKRN